MVNARFARLLVKGFRWSPKEKKGFLVLFDVRSRSYTTRRCCTINTSARFPHTNAQNTKLGHYSTAVSTRSEARMTRGWSNRLSAIGSRLRRFQAASDKFVTKNLKSHLPAVFSNFMTPTPKLDIKF